VPDVKKIIFPILFLIALSLSASAAEDSVTTTANGEIDSVFSIEFFNDASVRYADGQISFPLYDPTSGDLMIATTAYVQGDGKSDVGVVCRTNIGQDWALKVRMANPSAGFEKTNVAIYKPTEVWDRNTGSPYSTGAPGTWQIISDVDETIFTGSGGLQNTTPNGILATFSFQVLPTGTDGTIGYGNVLNAGIYSFDVVYTLTTSL
jgi:hypothetical protein